MAPRILSLRLFYFASFAALGAFAPFFPPWLVARGVDGVAMGATLATLPAMGLVGPPLVGLVADTFGIHGRMLRLTTLGAFVSLVALALVGGGRERMTTLVLFGIVLAYAAFRSPMVVMADVVALDQAPKAGVSYGRVRNWGSVGAIVGALAVGRVVDPQRPSALPLAVAVPLLVALLATFALPEGEKKPHLSIGDEARALIA
jgi:PPP family 3-phenylpropionic acid transporter